MQTEDVYLQAMAMSLPVLSRVTAMSLNSYSAECIHKTWVFMASGFRWYELIYFLTFVSSLTMQSNIWLLWEADDGDMVDLFVLKNGMRAFWRETDEKQRQRKVRTLPNLRFVYVFITISFKKHYRLHSYWIIILIFFPNNLRDTLSSDTVML